MDPLIFLAQAAPGTVELAVVVAAVTLIGGSIGIVKFLRREPNEQRIVEQPVHVKLAERYATLDHCQALHATLEHGQRDVVRRVDGHDAQLDQLWNTMRAEDAAIRRDNSIKFEAIMEALGEIKGRLNIRKG